jgi:cyclase
VSTLAEVTAQRDYLALVEREATARHAAGMDAWEAARDIALGVFGEWGEHGRLAVNVETVYRHLDSGFTGAPVTELFARMAHLERIA